jgi:hypothetical protein
MKALRIKHLSLLWFLKNIWHMLLSTTNWRSSMVLAYLISCSFKVKTPRPNLRKWFKPKFSLGITKKQGKLSTFATQILRGSIFYQKQSKLLSSCLLRICRWSRILRNMLWNTSKISRSLISSTQWKESKWENWRDSLIFNSLHQKIVRNWKTSWRKTRFIKRKV